MAADTESSPAKMGPSGDIQDEQNYYTIEQVAAQTGLTKRTLRYYEEMSLLPPTGRTEGNYRRYTTGDLQRLQRIKELRDLLGFSLNDIREILQTEDERDQLKVAYQHETDALAKVAQLERSDELLREQLQLVERKIAGLERMRTDILARLEKHAQKIKTLHDNG